MVVLHELFADSTKDSCTLCFCPTAKPYKKASHQCYACYAEIGEYVSDVISLKIKENIPGKAWRAWANRLLSSSLQAVSYYKIPQVSIITLGS